MPVQVQDCEGQGRKGQDDEGDRARRSGRRSDRELVLGADDGTAGSSIVDCSLQPKRQKWRGAILGPRDAVWARSGWCGREWKENGEGANLGSGQRRWQSVTCSLRCKMVEKQRQH